MIASDVARAGFLASIPIAYALDALTFGQLYAVAFLTGTFAVIFDISHMTLYVPSRSGRTTWRRTRS